MAAPLALPEGITSFWGWASTSGLLPADIYLRHCLLAVRKAGAIAEASFLDDTVLADRVTTLREYLGEVARLSPDSKSISNQPAANQRLLGSTPLDVRCAT